MQHLELISSLPLRECILEINDLLDFSGQTGILFSETDKQFPFHHVVYVEGEQNSLVIHAQAVKKEHLRTPAFNQCLARLPFYDYESLLFLTTAYARNPSEDFDHLLKRFFSNCRGTYFDYWFRPSYGYLLYHVQLEHLYCTLSGKRRKEAAVFRHDWNLKKPEAKRLIREILVRKDLTLYELIEHRFLNNSQFVYSPNYRGAYLLAELLEKRGLNKLMEMDPGVSPAKS